MIELILTCFPLLIRIAYLRIRRVPVTLYNVHRALFVWLALFIALVFVVEYYHPLTNNALIPFRTVPVVAERGGTVTQLEVVAGQHVDVGDLLFAVDDAREKAAVAVAQAAVEELQAETATAKAVARKAEQLVAHEKALFEETLIRFENESDLRGK